jgi:hypothetical protein
VPLKSDESSFDSKSTFTLLRDGIVMGWPTIAVRDVRRHKFLIICLTFTNECSGRPIGTMEANFSCCELPSSSRISFSGNIWKKSRTMKYGDHRLFSETDLVGPGATRRTNAGEPPL